nr:sensor histidine kinase [Halalkalibacter oceani]
MAIDLGAVFSSFLALFLVYSLADLYQVELKNKILHSILYAVLMSIVNFISIYILFIIDSDSFFNFEPVNLSTTGKSLLLSCILMFAVIQFIRLMVKQQLSPLPYRYYFLFLFIPGISIYLVNVLAYYSEKNTHFFISVIGLLFLNMFVIYMFETMMEKLRLGQEKDKLKKQMEYQEANYEKTVHNFKSIKQIIHDTNHHFLYIEECIKRNEPLLAVDHIRLTLNKVEDTYHRVNTGNLVIDALVTNALNIGQTSGIRVDTKLSLHSQQLNIERYDLCVVLGNMLDNAMEASKRVRRVGDRYILVRIHSTETALSIQVMNHTEGEVTSFKSKKPNREYHGIGLTNISNICDKYGGSMAIETSKTTFTIMAVLPLGG